MANDTTQTTLAIRLRPRHVLLAFCAALAAFALTRTGRSTESVDVRTYTEMARSIALHGLPYFDNGPADQFVPLRSPFNLYNHGHLWGIYGPVYGYFAALPFKLGGLRGASMATCALLIPIALVTRRLAFRLLDDDWYATAAAVLVVLSTPVLGKSLELSGYPLSMLLAVAATTTTLEAATSSGGRRLAFSVASGVLYALGAGTHMLGVPVAMALVCALGASDATSDEMRGPTWLEKTMLRALWPTRTTIASAVVAFATMVLCLVPLALLNKVRFDSYNPFSYGPVPWHGMELLAAQDQTISAHIRSAIPVLVLGAIGIVVWNVSGIALRRPWIGRLVFFAGAVVATSALPVLREAVVRYAKCLYAFIVDQSLVDLGGPYHRLPGTFGNIQEPWLTKSTLQCTPILFLALFVPRVSARQKQMLAIVLAPCLALYTYLGLRGNLPLWSGLGVPWVYIRYTLPGLPMLLVAAMLVIKEAKFRARDALVALAVGAVLTVVLVSDGWDGPLYRQVLVLVVPIIATVIAAACVVEQRRGRVSATVTGLAIAATIGIGIGIGAGHDLRAHIAGKNYCDMRADAMRRATPERFGMFGYHPTLDPVLAVTMERDAEYGDMAEGRQDLDGWQHIRPLVDHWFAEDRPVFMVADRFATVPPPWPDVTVEPVDKRAKIYRIRPRVSAPAP